MTSPTSAWDDPEPWVTPVAVNLRIVYVDASTNGEQQDNHGMGEEDGVHGGDPERGRPTRVGAWPGRFRVYPDEAVWVGALRNLVCLDDAALLLGESEHRVRDYVAAGKLVTTRVQSVRLFGRDEVVALAGVPVAERLVNSVMEDEDAPFCRRGEQLSAVRRAWRR